VRIPDEVLRCIGFIGEVTHQDSAGVQGDLHATGFFVAIPCESPELRQMEMRTSYFVTAKHVATDMKDREVYFLVNSRGGGVVIIAGVFGQHWFLHPSDDIADVAVIQVVLNSEADVKGIALDHFGLPERLKQYDIGIGDEVFITGLFTAVPGTTQNMPIIRSGNLAMLPREQVQTELGYADAYLVEARSIGGLSGSPVFVRNTVCLKIERRDGSEDLIFGNGGETILLGLMQAHWDVDESELNNPQIRHVGKKRGVNLGIGIVVPAYKIYETLYQPALVAMRKEQEKIYLKQSVPGMDSARRKQDEQSSFTQQDFNKALQKVSRKIPRTK
jgi:hypothetical protein